MHKIFLSFHSADIAYKDALVDLNRRFPMFIDGSVDAGDIADDLPDESIRQKIRDEYLRDSTVTIVLVGQETMGRKHVDWELYSSMFDGAVNKRSGILAVLLPAANPGACYIASHENEKAVVYPETTNWVVITTRAGYEALYPYLPDRIIDQLLNSKARVSVVPWEKLSIRTLPLLINNAFDARITNEYDLSRAMRRANS